MRPLLAALSTLLLLPASSSAPAQAYVASPKLVVILVIDQFRGDYLDRFRADFKAPNGFNLFLKQGAYFNSCYYDDIEMQSCLIELLQESTSRFNIKGYQR